MCPTALGRKEKKLYNVHIVQWQYPPDTVHINELGTHRQTKRIRIHKFVFLNLKARYAAQKILQQHRFIRKNFSTTRIALHYTWERYALA